MYTACQEPYANFVANALNGWIIDPAGRDGCGFISTWTYASYNSSTDTFGTSTQDTIVDGSGVPVDCAPTGTLDDTLCGSSGNYRCVASNREFRRHSFGNNNTGICAKKCTTNAQCQPGLFCQGTSPNTACFPDDYQNMFFQVVGARLAFDYSWRQGLSYPMYALQGQSNNPSRDFVGGSDNYYDIMTSLDPAYRYVVTRAFRSVYTGSGFVPHDDFTDYPFSATVVPILHASSTPIWWGNGSSAYPRFEDWFDVDYVAFRGVGGASYTINMSRMSWSTVSPQINVYRLNSSLTQVGVGAGGVPSATFTTGALPADDWYVVRFSNNTLTTGDWQASIGLASTGMDDFSSTLSEAYPMSSGWPIAAVLESVWDQDSFRIDVPTAAAGTSITITGAAGATISAFNPSGAYVGSGVSNYTVASAGAGRWSWQVFGGGVVSGSYSTAATLGCAGSGCDANPNTISAANAWGDRWAGRILNSSNTATYQFNLTRGQHATFALSHSAVTCNLSVDVLPPPEATFFTGGQPIVTYADGAAVRDPGGGQYGPGGHVVGNVVGTSGTGTYGLRVRTNGSSLCSAYRLFLALTPFTDSAVMPTW
ncbi:MAG: hypothetical protein WCJ30_04850 [Deltaproteobacteria bacterium]